MADGHRLTARAVNAAFSECLFRPEDAFSDEPKKVEAITGTVCFQRDRLETKRNLVRSWFDELPPEFLVGIPTGGGGWSFLNLCNRSDGSQWTGLHSTMQEFCAMAIGLGLGHWLLPRDVWDMLPGGMPYVQFTASDLLPAESRS